MSLCYVDGPCRGPPPTNIGGGGRARWEEGGTQAPSSRLDIEGTAVSMVAGPTLFPASVEGRQVGDTIAGRWWGQHVLSGASDSLICCIKSIHPVQVLPNTWPPVVVPLALHEAGGWKDRMKKVEVSRPPFLGWT